MSAQQESFDDNDNDSRPEAEQQRITDEVQAIAKSRALIDQTKGMLMFIYGIEEDAAFDLLRWQSQQHNVKLRLIAEQILKDLVELSQSKAPIERLPADNVLLTAHYRIAHVAERQNDGSSQTVK